MARRWLAVVTVAAVLGGVWAALPPAHKTALNDFHTATGGSGWTSRAGWATAGDPCGAGWFGVTCIATPDSVVYVRRRAVNRQTAPSCCAVLCCRSCERWRHFLTALRWLASLVWLRRELQLSANNLIGTLPSSLSVLTTLTYVSSACFAVVLVVADAAACSTGR
jgi:hypothetical protein